MQPVFPDAFHPHTRYDDLVAAGTADLSDGAESMAALARLGGVDIDRFRPAGLHLQWESNRWTLMLLVVPRGRELEARLPIQRVPLNLPPDKLLRHLPQLEIIALDRSLDTARFEWAPSEPQGGGQPGAAADF